MTLTHSISLLIEQLGLQQCKLVKMSGVTYLKAKLITNTKHDKSACEIDLAKFVVVL